MGAVATADIKIILALFRAIPSGDEIRTDKTTVKDSSTSLGMTRRTFRANAKQRRGVKKSQKLQKLKELQR
jgi:hypothetical protein